MITVILPSSLARLFPGAPTRVAVEATTVLGAIDQLNYAWPGLRDRLVASGPTIRQHLNLFVNGEKATLATPLPPSGELHIFTAVSGG